jgi:hypothetical protein
LAGGVSLTARNDDVVLTNASHARTLRAPGVVLLRTIR